MDLAPKDGTCIHVSRWSLKEEGKDYQVLHTTQEVRAQHVQGGPWGQATTAGDQYLINI